MGGCASKFEETECNIEGVRPIIINSETWKRDSHGLFDYETNDVVRKTLKIVGNTQIYRENDSLEMTKCKYQSNKRGDVVLDVSYESRHNTINDAESSEEEKNVFGDDIREYNDALLSKD